MNCRNKRFRIDLATPADAAEILQIYESGDFLGKISVLYTRRPDPWYSLQQEGEEVVIPILREQKNNRICGMGCCVLRSGYLNGEIKRIGYLTGLKVLPEYRQKLLPIADVYQFLYEQTKDKVDFFYTTILRENVAVQKMLEKKRARMPRYFYLGDYTVYCFRLGKKRARKVRGDYLLNRGLNRAVQYFIAEQEKAYQLSVPVSNKVTEQEEKEYFSLTDAQGNVLAACALWNQQDYKQYIITGYHGLYRLLRKLPIELWGYPPLPLINSPANYASVVQFYVQNDDPHLARYFLERVAGEAKQYDFLMWGLFSGHPLQSLFTRIRHFHYQSRVYSVHWPAENYHCPLDGRPYNCEVAYL